ncbi:MAG: hypothetical protein ACYDDU_18170 [Dermatophilaceae bacterium]
MHKKSFAVLGALAAFGALTASAASLGGLTSSTLGAAQVVVAPCQPTTAPGIGLAYTNVYNAKTNAYQTTAVTMSNVDAACGGKQFQLTLSDGVPANAANWPETTGTFPTPASGSTTTVSQTVKLGTPANAALITVASLVITG